MTSMDCPFCEESFSYDEDSDTFPGPDNKTCVECEHCGEHIPTDD